MATVSNFIDLVSGGESEVFWSRFVSTRPMLHRQLTNSFTNEENEKKLEQLKKNYQTLMPQCNLHNGISNTVRDTILMVLNDVLSKAELLSCLKEGLVNRVPLMGDRPESEVENIAEDAF